MADAQILSTKSQAVPKDYTLPQAQELLVKACYAAFDGSSATSAYLPTLEFISNAGDTIAICPLGSSIAAGASADVSWFRGVTSTGGGGTASTAKTGYYTAANTTIGANLSANLAISYNRGDVVLDLTTPTQPKFPATGVYAMAATVSNFSGWVAGDVCKAEFQSTDQLPLAPHILATGTGGTSSYGTFDINLTWTVLFDKDSTFLLTVTNLTGGSRTVAVNEMLVTYWPTS